VDEEQIGLEVVFMGEAEKVNFQSLKERVWVESRKK
jgi:hypothetical protein